MSSREQGQQLLEAIDAVLEECGKDLARRRPARPVRSAWRGPSWLEGALAGGGHQPHRRTS